jgi:hypothetical protein
MAKAPKTTDSQLDALIARIHGLSGVVGRRGAAAEPLSERPDLAAPAMGSSGDSGPTPAELREAILKAQTLRSTIDAAPAAVQAQQPAIVQPQSKSQPPQVAPPVAELLAGMMNSGPDFGGPDFGGPDFGGPDSSLADAVVPSPDGHYHPTRAEPWRPVEPTSLEGAGVLESSLEQLMMRFLLSRGECEGRLIADQVKLPFRFVEPVLDWLKMEQSLALKRGTATGDYFYVLTEKGRAQAKTFTAECTYFGACPVPLHDYIDSVKHQSVEAQKPKSPELKKAFADLLINPQMLDRLGPAVNSGRGMFLYGSPGNGKTSIAERVTAAFGKYIWIPRAIDIDGDIMRVYDPMSHEADMPKAGEGLLDQSGFDKRWIRIRRPTIIAGGELTMDMLEVQSSKITHISEAPLQMKSNCGTLVIDDFGRQKMSVDQLLNRWIVPLEKRFDFLNMPSGKKIQVPFDQLVIFSTNLEPRDLVDDAFLRRIPYKIEVCNPSEADFRKLFEIMCRVLKIPYLQEPIDYLIAKHYLPISRPFRNCQPRDLLLQVQNYCRYHDRVVELRNEYFDYAVENYFSIM